MPLLGFKIETIAAMLVTFGYLNVVQQRALNTTQGRSRTGGETEQATAHIVYNTTPGKSTCDALFGKFTLIWVWAASHSPKLLIALHFGNLLAWDMLIDDGNDGNMSTPPLSSSLLLGSTRTMWADLHCTSEPAHSNL
jgi:hypothetical protein